MPRTRRARWHVTLLAVLLGLGACSEPPPTPKPVRSVRTLTLQPSSGAAVHEYAAELRARTEASLSFRVGGKLVQRMVGVGDAVKPGQALARIDPADLQLGQQAAAAAVQAAQAQLALNEADFKRYQALRGQGFISGAELERREATLKASQAQAEQARAQASLQLNQARYAQLTADVAGVVTAVDAEPGTVLAAGMPVLRLAHDGPRDVVFAVPEDRAGALRGLMGRPGQVQMRLWGDGQPWLPATVREVAAAADPVTRTFRVKADVGAAAVRLGQTASVRLVEPTSAGLLQLPLTAVFHHGQGSAVWLLDAQTMAVRVQPVQVAGALGNQAVVASGLAPGQEVVVAGVHVLSPGEVVRRYVEPGKVAAVPVAAAAVGQATAPAAPPSTAQR